MNDETNIYAENGVVHKSMFSGNSCGHSGLAVLTGRVGLQGQETTFHEKRAYPFGVRELAPAFKASASRRISIGNRSIRNRLCGNMRNS